jgi:hypothetical protein
VIRFVQLRHHDYQSASWQSQLRQPIVEALSLSSFSILTHGQYPSLSSNYHFPEYARISPLSAQNDEANPLEANISTHILLAIYTLGIPGALHKDCHFIHNI